MPVIVDKELEKRIDQWALEHRQQMLEDLIRLVKIPSVSCKDINNPPYGEGCRRALAELFEIGGKYGFKHQNFDWHCGSLWLEEHPDAKIIGLWGHLDVVPEGDGWDYAPYEPVVKDGYLIGRGSQDNKGPTIADLYLLRCMHELGLPMKASYRLYVGCDEENGMEDMAYFTKHYSCPDLSIITDSGFPVCYGEKGMLGVDMVSKQALSPAITELSGGRASNIVPDAACITLADGQLLAFKGISKHTAFPEGGLNAIAVLCAEMMNDPRISDGDKQIFGALSHSHCDFYGTGLGIECSDELSGKLTCVGSMIKLEDGYLVQHYNIRYPITADSDALQAKLAAWADANGFSVRIARDSKPNHFPKEHPAVSILTDSYNAIEGRDAKPSVMGGGTYARKLPNAFAYGMGLPAGDEPKIFAPGHGDCHGPDEAQYIDNLLRAIKIMIIGLVNLDREWASV